MNKHVLGVIAIAAFQIPFEEILSFESNANWNTSKWCSRIQETSISEKNN